MTETLTIKYGKGRLPLTRSDRLVAVKPAPGMASRLERTLHALPGAVARKGETLGGFKILDISAGGTDVNAQLEQLRAHATVDVGTHVYHTGNDDAPFVPTGDVYIEFAPSASPEERQKLIDDCHLQIIEARGTEELITRVTPASENPVKTALKLQQSDLVSVAEPELATPGHLKAVPVLVDLLLGEQWHLRNTGHHRGTGCGFKEGADARVRDAWERLGNAGTPDVVVAVIDDGFDLAHPDLSGPGKVVHPWDFTRNSGQPVPDPDAGDWHGTACAGVAVGRLGGGLIAGAAPGATLMPVRWGRNLADREIENWFGYVERMGAWVVSCSWGAAADYFPLSTRASRAIARCASQGRHGKGCVIVFAAGNANHDIDDADRGTLDGFAIHEDVIAVAASTSRDERSHYSNFGAAICVCAPSSGAGGWGILTADVTGVDHTNNRPLGYAPGDYTYDFGGTSSACPLVAGICALILSAAPDLRPPEVRAILEETARPIGGVTGHSREFGFGCVDADKAVKAALALAVGQPVA